MEEKYKEWTNMTTIEKIKTKEWYFSPTEEVASRVAQCVEEGGVALFPADTVYGFFGNALDPKSYERVYEIKKRERRKPFVIYTNAAQVEQVADLNPMARKLIERFWPHEALALVLPKKSIISDRFTDGKDTIAVMSAGGDFISEVMRNCNAVMFGTTCNMSGLPEVIKIDEAREFAEQVDIAVGGDQLLKHSVPSTIVDCTGDEPRILRESAIPATVIMEACRD
ncbi:L-threonylcarbamoyladenylate synthase [Marinobacter sp. LM1]|jgi:L-threonylcarbamoyladenylate synthase|uniref:L-threonylcarbamoyladenylate synthase n=1 Tax=Marinobacter sp. LM1 TaxID=3003349 RepID=UPI001A14DCBA|nr:Sua5/YciO/YrdC/YwlC family protein [Alphaproteobacteria bacterium]